MAKGVDYSKWDHIEISDDEDDTHPNIDTPSLFRWRHQARVERMEKDKKEKEDFQQGLTQHQKKMNEIRQKIKEAEEKEAADQLEKLKLEMSEVEKQNADFKKKEEELKRKERLTPLNVDTICKEGKSKTIINKFSKPSSRDDLTDEEKADRQEKFTKENEKLLKKFGMMRRYEDSQQMLSDNPHLACEETANYLVVWCINLEVEEKHDLMEHVAHQTIVMQFILELAKSLETDPRACIRAFFSRIKLAEKQYLDAFNDELNSFKERVRARSKARLEEAMKAQEEEERLEREQRLGPGGLDPMEVFESLPQELQDCFESKDITQLQKAIASMKPADAEYHMKRCVDSGLWVPGPKDAGEEKDEKDKEPVYETIPGGEDDPEK